MDTRGARERLIHISGLSEGLALARSGFFAYLEQMLEVTGVVSWRSASNMFSGGRNFHGETYHKR